jgi:peptidoglycan/LPS O-acetylase OafA/YrhL
MKIAPYYPQLDSLRAIAVILVLLSHYYVGGPWGDFGVRLFFVLSGFLITSIICTHRENMAETGFSPILVAKNFYIRRSLRLFPIYYIALLIFVALEFSSKKQYSSIFNDWPFHFFYLTNVLVFLRGEWVGPLSPYWSLSVEEQFYLIWFWLILLFPRKILPYAIVLTIFLAPIFRLSAFLLGFNSYSDFLLPACLDMLASGSLLAVVTHDYYRRQFLNIILWCKANSGIIMITTGAGSVVLLMISYGLDKESLPKRLGVNIVSSFVFVIIVYICHQGVGGWFGKLLSSNWLVQIGKFSYGIYIYHMLVFSIFVDYFDSLVMGSSITQGTTYYGLIRFLALTFVTLLVSYCSWIYIETPILRLKNRFSEGIGSI